MPYSWDCDESTVMGELLSFSSSLPPFLLMNPQPSWQIYVPTDGIYMGSLEMCCFMAWLMHLHKQPEVVPLYFPLLLPLSFYFDISQILVFLIQITHYDSNLSIHYFYFQTTVIFGIFFRTTSFYDHILKLIFQLAEITSPLPFLSISFLICLRKSLN